VDTSIHLGSMLCKALRRGRFSEGLVIVWGVQVTESTFGLCRQSFFPVVNIFWRQDQRFSCGSGGPTRNPSTQHPRLGQSVRPFKKFRVDSSLCLYFKISHIGGPPFHSLLRPPSTTHSQGVRNFSGGKTMRLLLPATRPSSICFRSWFGVNGQNLGNSGNVHADLEGLGWVWSRPKSSCFS
jgi:hypothetical protein